MLLFTLLKTLLFKAIKTVKLLLIGLLVISCSKDDFNTDNTNSVAEVFGSELPSRCDIKPETTPGVPHVQIDVDLVPAVHAEMIRRIYSLPGVEDHPSVVGGWRGMWLSEELDALPAALIGGREFGHIHTDGSLHIFLNPSRAFEAETSCWAILHPFAVERLEGWDGFVMLYTPQSISELDVTFSLIVDGYNYATGQNISASDYYGIPFLEYEKN